MKDLFTVASFSIKDMLSRKSFIIGTIIILVLIVIGFNVPNIIKSISGDESGEMWNENILIVDSKNIFEGSLQQLNSEESGYNLEILNEEISIDKIKEKIENEEIDYCLILNKEENTLKVDYLLESLDTFASEPTQLIDMFTDLYTNLQISKLGLSQEQLNSLNIGVEMNTIETDENAAGGNVLAIMLLSIVLFYAIYFCAYQVSSSITTEKTSKIMETLVTSTTPKTIVLGKTIGIGIVGLIQVAAIILVSIISANLFLEEGMLDAVLDMSNITPMLAILTLVYFILGYALYALLYALTGSTVSKPEDINSANGPIAVLAVIGFYLAYFSMMNPTSDINVFASIFPLSASFSMPFRIMMGTATTMEILGSIVVLIISIIIIASISIKIYSSAILNYGTKLNFKDMLNIYKDKNN